jgi:large subunit ribosomal protein L23
MNAERLYKVLKGPHVSEKAAMSADNGNGVVFKVANDANKTEIKAAVEKLFKVKVTAVRTLNVKGKVKRNRFGASKKPSWKKAYVSLAQGHDIDFTVVD